MKSASFITFNECVTSVPAFCFIIEGYSVVSIILACAKGMENKRYIAIGIKDLFIQK